MDLATIGDSARAIRDAITERVANPLLTSFCIAWSIWNFEFLMIMLSDNPVSVVLSLVKIYSFTNLGDVLIFGILLPAVSAAGYLYLMPIPERHVFEYRLRHQRALGDVKRSIEEETLLTIEESRSLRERAIKNETELKKRVDDLEKENRELTAIIARPDVKQKLAPKAPQGESGDVPPILSSTAVWSPIPQTTEVGREEAVFGRTDHRVPA